MMTALAKEMRASMTRSCRSVQMASFLKPRLCQEFVRSTTHRAPACNGKPLMLITPSQPNSSSRSRVLVLSLPGVQVDRDPVGQAHPESFVESGELLQGRA